MVWPFCPQCRATLKVNSTGAIQCDICHYESNLSNMDYVPTTTTYSATRPVPLWAKSDMEQETLRQSTTNSSSSGTTKGTNRATIEEPCPKCEHKEVGYYTVQLRSVDEGQTVFYECPNCKYTWSVNN